MNNTRTAKVSNRTANFRREVREWGKFGHEVVATLVATLSMFVFVVVVLLSHWAVKNVRFVFPAVALAFVALDVHSVGALVTALVVGFVLWRCSTVGVKITRHRGRDVWNFQF